MSRSLGRDQTKNDWVNEGGKYKRMERRKTLFYEIINERKKHAENKGNDKEANVDWKKENKSGKDRCNQ